MINKININPAKQKLIVYVVLTVVTLAVYWQVNQYDFVNSDDTAYVPSNIDVHTRITLDTIRMAFSTTFVHLWDPLIRLSLILDYQIYGLKAGGYHVTNVLLHILNTLLLFWLFNRMTHATWKSAFVAAFFAVHPLHVESVAWVSERKDVLSAFFWMLTLCMYVYYAEKPAVKRYLTVLFAFILALLSKPMVVSLPVIMILLDYWPLKRFKTQKSKTNLILWQMREKTPFFILSAIISIITIYTQQEAYLKHFPFGSRMANAAVSFVSYLEKIFWPQDLAVLYPFSTQIPVLQIMGASLMILIVSVTVIFMMKRWPYLFVGWLWYIITLLPVTGIVKQVNEAAIADHFTYLPSIGIGIMLVWGIPLLFPREDMRRKILFSAGTAVLTILAVLTWHQCGYWRNSITLFSHALQVTKDNAPAHNSIGLALFAQGKNEAAIYHFNKAIRIMPNFPEPYNNRGIVSSMQGNKELGCRDVKKACELAKCELLEVFKVKGLCH